MRTVRLIPLRSGATLSFGEGDSLVGRSPRCNARIAHYTVAEEHCRLRIGKDSILVQDLGSATGLVVNGQETKRSFIEHGDRLDIGGVPYRVEVIESPVARLPDADATVTIETAAAEATSAPPAVRSAVAVAPLTESLLRPISTTLDSDNAEGRDSDRSPRSNGDLKPTVSTLSAGLAASDPPKPPPVPTTAGCPITPRTQVAVEPIAPGRLGWSDFGRRARETVSVRPKAIVLLAAFAVLAISSFVPWSRFGGNSNESIYRKYAGVLENVGRLRDTSASPKEWERYTAELRVENERLLKELQRTAGVRDPARQHLLFAARDHVPEILDQASLGPCPAEEHLRVALSVVRQCLDGRDGGAEQAPPKSEPAADGAANPALNPLAAPNTTAR